MKSRAEAIQLQRRSNASGLHVKKRKDRRNTKRKEIKFSQDAG